MSKPMCKTMPSGEKIHYSQENWRTCSCGEVTTKELLGG